MVNLLRVFCTFLVAFLFSEQQFITKLDETFNNCTYRVEDRYAGAIKEAIQITPPCSGGPSLVLSKSKKKSHPDFGKVRPIT
jgi:hypothetical protein